ncbi:hypothetical protein [Polaromonas glacialis]|uniref:hypothetical protein n=1 Tax=Polaromonas glacialis TaxID=866564 RepID=UPI0012EBE10A|nr:hypothetical protein [Polaromonas glacialis]
MPALERAIWPEPFHELQIITAWRLIQGKQLPAGTVKCKDGRLTTLMQTAVHRKFFTFHKDMPGHTTFAVIQISVPLYGRQEKNNASSPFSF